MKLAALGERKAHQTKPNQVIRLADTPGPWGITRDRGSHAQYQVLPRWCGCDARSAPHLAIIHAKQQVFVGE